MQIHKLKTYLLLSSLTFVACYAYLNFFSDSYLYSQPRNTKELKSYIEEENLSISSTGYGKTKDNKRIFNVSYEYTGPLNIEIARGKIIPLLDLYVDSLNNDRKKRKVNSYPFSPEYTEVTIFGTGYESNPTKNLFNVTARRGTITYDILPEKNAPLETAHSETIEEAKAILEVEKKVTEVPSVRPN